MANKQTAMHLTQPTSFVQTDDKCATVFSLLDANSSSGRKLEHRNLTSTRHSAERRCVFSLLLKDERVSQYATSYGKSFEMRDP